MLSLSCQLLKNNKDWCVAVGNDGFLLQAAGEERWVENLVILIRTLLRTDFNYDAQIEVIKEEGHTCVLRLPAETATIAWLATRLNKQRRLHVADINQATGVIHPVISRMFRAVTAPNLPTFCKICEAFDLDVEISFRKTNRIK